jgi:hypothetical protein
VTDPERCAECGFDSTRLTIPDAIAGLRSMGRRWRELFATASDDDLRRRPAPDVWSPVEYADHTGSMLALVGFGMGDVLDGASPDYPDVPPPPPGPDRSPELDVRITLDKLEQNADRIADRADKALKLPDRFQRTGNLGGTTVTAEWLLFHALHDASHHLKDVEKALGTR